MSFTYSVSTGHGSSSVGDSRHTVGRGVSCKSLALRQKFLDLALALPGLGLSSLASALTWMDLLTSMPATVSMSADEWSQRCIILTRDRSKNLHN